MNYTLPVRLTAPFLGLLLVTTPASALETINFDDDGFAHGDTVSAVTSDGGEGPIAVFGENPADPVSGGGANWARAFDSNNPTCGDDDLGTPNEKCPGGGPGVGAAGEPGQPNENCGSLDNVLILQEIACDAGGCTPTCTPDDGSEPFADDADAPDGMFFVDFSAIGVPVTLVSVDFLDVEADEADPVVSLLDGSNALVNEVTGSAVGDNGFGTIDLGPTAGVSSMVFDLNGSGGIDNIVFYFCGDGDVDPGEDCDDGNMDDNDGCSSDCDTEERPLECRMTGGGNDRGYDSNNRYTFGGQAGAPTASQPQPFGEWTHHQRRGADGRFVFHAGTASAPRGTEIDEITCSDPGWCSAARHAPAKQLDFQGVGSFRNLRSPTLYESGARNRRTRHWFEVHIEDLGEPGSERGDENSDACPAMGNDGEVAMCGCLDYYRITIYKNFNQSSEDPNKTDVIYEEFGYLNGGNLQIHPPVGGPQQR